MKRSNYALAGAIAAERGLTTLYGEPDKDGNKTILRQGLVITTPEAENHEELLTLMEDGKEEHADRLAQGQLDIIRQRKIREAAEDEVTADIIAGKKLKLDVDLGDYGAEGDEVDFGQMDDDQRRDAIRARCQAVGDAYLYGARGPSTGAGKVTKEKAAKQSKLEAAATAGELDEATIAKLKELGVL